MLDHEGVFQHRLMYLRNSHSHAGINLQGNDLQVLRLLLC